MSASTSIPLFQYVAGNGRTFPSFNTRAPYLILLGNISSLESFRDFINYQNFLSLLTFRYDKVFIVPGIAEHFRQSPESTGNIMRSMCAELNDRHHFLSRLSGGSTGQLRDSRHSKHSGDFIHNSSKFILLNNSSFDINSDIRLTGTMFWKKLPGVSTFRKKHYDTVYDFIRFKGVKSMSDYKWSELREASIEHVEQEYDMSRKCGRKLIVASHFSPSVKQLVQFPVKAWISAGKFPKFNRGVPALYNYTEDVKNVVNIRDLGFGKVEFVKQK